ncbi:MAG: ABC transporter substrate-binding protein, partial [bacterium]
MKTNFLKCCLMAVSLSVVPFASAFAADCVHKVGGLAPLSAPGSVVGGEAMRDAMLLAERDVNAAGGVLGCDLEVVITDTEGLPEKATAMMEKLITQDGVVAVGGG